MSSKENLKDTLKRTNRKLQELREINIKLQKENEELNLRLKLVYHQYKYNTSKWKWWYELKARIKSTFKPWNS